MRHADPRASQQKPDSVYLGLGRNIYGQVLGKCSVADIFHLPLSHLAQTLLTTGCLSRPLVLDLFKLGLPLGGLQPPLENASSCVQKYQSDSTEHNRQNGFASRLKSLGLPCASWAGLHHDSANIAWHAVAPLEGSRSTPGCRGPWWRITDRDTGTTALTVAGGALSCTGDGAGHRLNVAWL